MLDMAFQLLAFFVLTFRQAPLEGQISLRLPPPQATVVVKNGEAAGSDAREHQSVAGHEHADGQRLGRPAIGHH